MMTFRLAETMRRLRATLCVAGVLAAASGAGAAEMLITAEFKPSALEPSRNTFANTTRPGQYCTWKPEECGRLNSYVVDIPVNIAAKTYVKGSTQRKRFYMGLPGPRRMTATNEAGRSIDVDVMIASVSGELRPGNNTNPVFTRSVGGGCSYIFTAGGGAWVRFGWNVRSPQAPAPCHSQGDGGGAGFTGIYSTSVLGLGFIVTTPSPLGMDNGLYRGQLQYTIGGQGSEIDLGDDVEMTDNVVVFNFEFLVAHDFKVERPPGTDRIVLQPANGWRDWMEQGRPPARIGQELPFLMTSSSDFRVQLACEWQVGDRCAIRSGSGEQAALDVSMTVPGLYDAATGDAVDGYRLAAGGMPPVFRVREYMQSRPSRLGFTVSGEPLRRMLELPGSTWRGEVTVIFDASL